MHLELYYTRKLPPPPNVLCLNVLKRNCWESDSRSFGPAPAKSCWTKFSILPHMIPFPASYRACRGPNTISFIYTCLYFTFMEFYQCNVYPLYSPKVFSVCFLLLVVCLLFKSNLVWFKLLLLVKDKKYVSFFCRWYPVFQIPSVEWNILSPICIFEYLYWKLFSCKKGNHF